MENVRYRVAATRRNKDKSSNINEMPTSTLNTAVCSRQAPSVGDSDNYHPGRRQRSRRRDVYAAPDDFVRPSPPVGVVFDAVRRDVDVRSKSPQFWAQPTFVAGSRTVARSRSRPRPPFLVERGVQRGEISGEYAPNAVDRSRFNEQQLTEDSRHRQRNPRQQQQQHRAAGLNHPPVEFAARCAVDCRPQITPTPPSMLSGRTVSSPTPAPLSPSYFSDNKTLLKEALISAAAAKLARSSSARSAVVKPLVVIRNGPSKSSSDEHVDADNNVATTTTTVKSLMTSDRPVSSAAVESPEHTADVAVAAAAAATAAATRRSRTRRRDAELMSCVTTPSAVVPVTSPTDGTGTRRTGNVNSNAITGSQVPQSNVIVSVVSAGIKAQDSAGCRVATDVDSSGSPSTTVQTSPSSNSGHRVDESQRLAVLLSTPGIIAAGAATQVSVTQDKMKKISDETDLQLSTSDARSNDRPRRDRDIQRVDKSINDSSVTEPNTVSDSDAADAGTRQESPSSSSKVSFIKSLLSRTRSPSPSRYRRSRSKVLHTSPSPASMKRLGAEVAQRISEPVKGYLKHLRDRSSQRRRPAETGTTSTTAETAVEPELSACEAREQSNSVDRQTTTGELTASSSNQHTDSCSRGRRRFKTDIKQQDNATSALTSPWKSTSELTTPMSRLDNLLKANSLQHLRAATNRPTVDKTSGDQTSSSTPSRLPLPSKTSKSTGCLLSSPAHSGTQQPAEQRQRATTMSRCYLEKPPRVARRAMTVQLDHRTVDRQTPPLAVAERHSTSQADLRNLQPVDNEEPAESSSKSTKNDDIGQPSMLATTTATSASAVTRQLQTAHNHVSSSERERDLRELYEQKRLERKLEEKLAVMEKERAEMIAKLWSQIDHRCETNSTRQRTVAAAVNDLDHLSNASSSSSGLVLPLSSNATSPTEHNNNQVVGDPLGDLLIELSSTPTTNRWSERRRAGRNSTTALRPRAASCSRRLMSDTPPAAAAAAALTSKSQSHTQLYRNPSSCSDVGQAHSSPVHLRQRSHQQLLPSSSRPLTCYLPARDRNVDLRRFIESAGHRLDQCDHVQLTSSTCHGYLSKLGDNATIRLWKRRWFVFDTAQRCLHYYTDKTEKRADGTFIWFQTIQDVFVDHGRRSRSPHPESTFCVKTVERPLFLVAPTPEAMRIWIDVIFTGAEGYQQFV